MLTADAPTTNGADPELLAAHVTSFARYYGFDGIDVDYEDFKSIDGGLSADWVSCTFTAVVSSCSQLTPALTSTLRAEMGSNFLISHGTSHSASRQHGAALTPAPTAPMFNPNSAPDGAYATVHKTVGADIDFYNIQYYNQGPKAYVDCEVSPLRR